MSKRDLVSIRNLTAEDVEAIWSLSARLKADLKAGRPHRLLEGHILSLIFAKPSLRTRMTFEVGIVQLGGHGITQIDNEIGVGKRESIHDVAKNLERWVHLIMIRTYKQADVEALARHASIPVINALTDDEHPCQALADLFTLREHKGALKGLTLAYVGDGNNVCHSLMLLCGLMGVNFRAGCPQDYAPDAQMVKHAQASAAKTGAKIAVMSNPAEAVAGADAVYTDIWASMGRESESEKRKKIFAPYQVNSALIAKSGGKPLIMHCLPAHRGDEITDEVIDSPQSIVFDQAENRLHVQKGLMVFLCNG